MSQVKIITAENHVVLEQRINDFLEEHPNVAITITYMEPYMVMIEYFVPQ